MRLARRGKLGWSLGALAALAVLAVLSIAYFSGVLPLGKAQNRQGYQCPQAPAKFATSRRAHFFPPAGRGNSAPTSHSNSAQFSSKSFRYSCNCISAL